MNHSRYSRRALLKHMGVSAALLPLISTERAQAAASGTGTTADGHPKRFVAVTHTNGVIQSSFFPPTSAKDLSAPLPPILAGLEAVKSKMITIQGLDYANILDTGQKYDGHFSYCSTLTGTRIPVKGSDGDNSSRKATGPSIDQTISDNLVKAGVNLKAPLLTLGIKSIGDGVSTSWRGTGATVAQNQPTTSASELFTKLFSSMNIPPAQMMQNTARDQSILDLVKGDFAAFGKRLGTDDRNKINIHLEAVRDLESRIQKAATVKSPVVDCTAPKINGASDFTNLAKDFFDMVAIAFACDVARVVTITMFDDGGGDPNIFSFDGGVKRGYHEVAHDTSATGRAQKVKIDTWIYSNVASLATQLNAAKEGDKTILDNSVIATFSDMNDGADHYNGKLPITLTGSCGGYFKTNQNLVFPAKTPINQLLTSICNAMDLPTMGVGDAKYAGALPGVKA